MYTYVQNDPVNWIDPWGLISDYDDYDFWDDFFTGEDSSEYRKYEEELKTEILEESARLGNCFATCVIEYVVGDLEQKGAKKAIQQALKTAAKLAVLAQVNKGVTYWSVAGLIKCSVRCCD